MGKSDMVRTHTHTLTQVHMRNFPHVCGVSGDRGYIVNRSAVHTCVRDDSGNKKRTRKEECVHGSRVRIYIFLSKEGRWRKKVDPLHTECSIYFYTLQIRALQIRDSYWIYSICGYVGITKEWRLQYMWIRGYPQKIVVHVYESASRGR